MTFQESLRFLELCISPNVRLDRQPINKGDTDYARNTFVADRYSDPDHHSAVAVWRPSLAFSSAPNSWCPVNGEERQQLGDVAGNASSLVHGGNMSCVSINLRSLEAGFPV